MTFCFSWAMLRVNPETVDAIVKKLLGSKDINIFISSYRFYTESGHIPQTQGPDLKYLTFTPLELKFLPKTLNAESCDLSNWRIVGIDSHDREITVPFFYCESPPGNLKYEVISQITSEGKVLFSPKIATDFEKREIEYIIE